MIYSQKHEKQFDFVSDSLRTLTLPCRIDPQRIVKIYNRLENVKWTELDVEIVDKRNTLVNIFWERVATVEEY